MSPAAWDHTVLPALNTGENVLRQPQPSRPVVDLLTLERWIMEGWVDIVVGFIPGWFTCL